MPSRERDASARSVQVSVLIMVLINRLGGTFSIRPLNMNLCTTYFYDITTPIGNLKVSYCCKGVHCLQICSGEIEILPVGRKDESDQVLDKLLSWLKVYFSSPHAAIEKPPVCPTVMACKGKFTQTVWQTLLSSVSSRETISYGNLATLCGHSRASRAVGSVMRSNPVPILIPCHRVIKADGSMGQYSGGKNVKMWLLNHEKAI